jgi:hypothetical protein
VKPFTPSFDSNQSLQRNRIICDTTSRRARLIRQGV